MCLTDCFIALACGQCLPGWIFCSNWGEIQHFVIVLPAVTSKLKQQRPCVFQMSRFTKRTVSVDATPGSRLSLNPRNCPFLGHSFLPSNYYARKLHGASRNAKLDVIAQHACRGLSRHQNHVSVVMDTQGKVRLRFLPCPAPRFIEV